VIIFDWDDTILPSSFVDKCQVDNVNELPQHFRSLFREIEICTETCLAEAAKFGEVRLGFGIMLCSSLLCQPGSIGTRHRSLSYSC
jgi:hypothetical protein